MSFATAQRSFVMTHDETSRVECVWSARHDWNTARRVLLTHNYERVFFETGVCCARLLCVTLAESISIGNFDMPNGYEIRNTRRQTIRTVSEAADQPIIFMRIVTRAKSNNVNTNARDRSVNEPSSTCSFFWRTRTCKTVHKIVFPEMGLLL